MGKKSITGTQVYYYWGHRGNFLMPKLNNIQHLTVVFVTFTLSLYFTAAFAPTVTKLVKLIYFFLLH